MTQENYWALDDCCGEMSLSSDQIKEEEACMQDLVDHTINEEVEEITQDIADCIIYWGYCREVSQVGKPIKIPSLSHRKCLSPSRRPILWPHPSHETLNPQHRVTILGQYVLY